MSDRDRAGLCADEVEDTDGTVFRCVLPRAHAGWHLDTFRMVDDVGLRLPCELRWAPKPVPLDDILR